MPFSSGMSRTDCWMARCEQEGGFRGASRQVRTSEERQKRPFRFQLIGQPQVRDDTRPVESGIALVTGTAGGALSRRVHVSPGSVGGTNSMTTYCSTPSLTRGATMSLEMVAHAGILACSFSLPSAYHDIVSHDSVRGHPSTYQARCAGRVGHPHPVWAIVRHEVLAPVLVKAVSAHDVLRSGAGCLCSEECDRQKGGAINEYCWSQP